MSLTCEIAEYQSIPRRKSIQRQRKLMNNLLKISSTLASIVVSDFCRFLVLFRKLLFMFALKKKFVMGFLKFKKKIKFFSCTILSCN